jgi:hypothetical protein
VPTTLEKIRRLEQYLTTDTSVIDPVLDSTIDKLLAREHSRVSELKLRLQEQCQEFEEKYTQESTDFYAKYEKGELGDDMDYMEWAATIEMLENVENRLALLEL